MTLKVGRITASYELDELKLVCITASKEKSGFRMNEWSGTDTYWFHDLGVVLVIGTIQKEKETLVVPVKPKQLAV